MGKYVKQVIILVILLFLAIKGRAREITLQACFDAAEKNHPALQKNNELNRINNLKLKNIQSSWYPEINLKGKVSNQSDVTSIDIDMTKLVPRENQGKPGSVPELPDPKPTQYDAALEINQKIYDFGTTSAQKELIETERKEDLVGVEVDFQAIKQRISKLYLQILTLQKHKAILESMLEDINASLEVVKSGVENGLLLPSDKYELNARKLETKQNIANIDHTISALYKNLKELTGLEDINQKNLQTPHVELNNNQEIMRPENKLFRIRREKLMETSTLKYKQKLPKIGGFVKAGYGRPGLNMLSGEFATYYIGGIQLSWNIWDWKRNKRERQILKINKEILNKSEKSFNKQIKTGLNQEKENIAKYQTMLESDSNIITLRKKVLKEYRSKLKNGTITSADYIKKLNSLSRAQLNYENHKIKLTNAKINYQLLRGEL